MKELQVFQNDRNFLVEKIVWEGKPALRKTLVGEPSQRRHDIFQNEIIGTDTFHQLTAAHPQWHLYIPKNLAKGENWVIREFVEGEELLEEGEYGAVAQQKLARLAYLLSQIDTVTPKTDYIPPVDSAPYTDIQKRLEVWSEQPRATGMLTAEMYTNARELITEYSPYLQPRYAHGDMMPTKHVFAQGETLAFIDFEHFSPLKPRYYDVAYAYSRLFTRMKTPSLAANFLHSFLETAETPSHQVEQLLAIMTQRAIGMHFDALNDATSGVHYEDRAKELLKRCLSRDLASLTQ